MLTKPHLPVSRPRASPSAGFLTVDANLVTSQGFARFIFNQTLPANLLASCAQPGDTLLGGGGDKSQPCHDPRRCRARSTRRVNTAHGRATCASPCQPCHNQHKSLSISTGSKGIMVLGRGEGGARHTKYWSRSYHLWLRDQPVWLHNMGQWEKKEEGSSFCLECCGFCTREGGQVSYKYTGKRRRRIPIKTSVLMGPTTVITRRTFQIRHLGS